VGAEGGSAAVEGVALELRARDGRALGPRQALPISGALCGCLMSTVELRSLERIPVGSKVTGLLWTPGNPPVEVDCPADLWTDLGDHVRGRRAAHADTRALELDDVEPSERARLVSRWPWIAEDMFPADVSGVLEQRDEDDSPDADALAAQFGLDEEAAEALRDILTEEG
jgi:hypothetical protein